MLLRTHGEKGYKGAENVRYVRKNAESRKQSLTELALSLVKVDKTEVIVAFSPQGLAAAIAAAQGKPVVYLSYSEPIPSATGLVAAVAPSPGSRCVDLARRLKPEVAEIGIVYDASELTSVASATSAQIAAQRSGLIATMLPLTIEGGVPTKPVSQLAVFVAWAPTMLEATIHQIFETTAASKVPVFTDNADLVSKGALAAYEVDWDALGREAGALVAAILDGGTPQTVKVEGTVTLTVNEKIAQELGIAIPADVVAQGKVIR